MADRVSYDIRRLAHELVASVTRDDCGQMIGQQWMGGHGGLLSRETLKVADALRLALAAPDDANLHVSSGKFAGPEAVPHE